MSMLLTISQPSKTEFGGRPTHDFSPRIPLAKSRLSPQPRIDSPVSSLRVSSTPDTKMSTPHRGLPPPSSMTLGPDPGRSLSALHVPFVGLPHPPPGWSGYEEGMRSWLAASAEADRRKQEEEKSKQEITRLETRRVEQSMLREALSAGVPPASIPYIYAGIGAANLAQISNEWLQQNAYPVSAVQQQLQQQQLSPELRRETRLIGQAPPSYPQQPPPQVLPSQHPEQPRQSVSSHPTFSAYQAAPAHHPPTSAPRSATHTQLPRLTTNDMYIQQPPQQGSGSAHPLQQSQTISQDQGTSSPSIYFHHWVPPESKNNMPQTPASKGEPHSAHPGSHLSESDYKESPRKRKAQGPHQPAPQPTTMYTSPPFSAISSGSRKKAGHTRSGSATSVREGDSRPDSRRDPESTSLPKPDSGRSSTEGQRPSELPPRRSEDNVGRLSVDGLNDVRAERPESRGSR